MKIGTGTRYHISALDRRRAKEGSSRVQLELEAKTIPGMYGAHSIPSYPIPGTLWKVGTAMETDRHAPSRARALSLLALALLWGMLFD